MKTDEYNLAVKLHTQRIYRFSCKMLEDKDSAKDVVQDAFLRLWEYDKQIEFDKIKSWLYTTSYRLCLELIEKKKRNVSDSILEDYISGNENYSDLTSVINHSLVLLTDVQKSVLMLKDYEGFKYKEISQILKISEDSVKTHLFRGRQKIKKYIKDINYVL